MFTAVDAEGAEIYHTNVVMCMGDTFAVICLESILDLAQRQVVSDALTGSGHEVIEISLAQMAQFAGNMLQVQNGEGVSYLVMSQTAYKSLEAAQSSLLLQKTKILPVNIRIIETIGGGSARCMMAEIFCPLRARES